LSAFLKKQKQKTAGTKGTDGPADASPEKDKADLAAAQAEQEAEQAKREQEAAAKAKAAAQKKGDSSDDESDDDLNTKVTYGKVQEKEEVDTSQADQDSKVVKDFADLDLESKAKEAEPAEKKSKKTASNITFGSGRPTFGNRAKQSAIMKDEGGLDDLDDDIKGKKAKKEEFAKATKMGSAAVPEESKGPAKPTRPTFRGKLNLTGAGADTTDSGVKAQYSFTNTYKTDKDEEEKSH